MKGFKVVSDFDPKGDQPQAIKKIAENLDDGLLNQTLLGVTHYILYLLERRWCKA